MTELKPCPFCGGEASKRLFYKGKYRVHCNACDAYSGDVYATEAEAIKAWNTRAERTCQMVQIAPTISEGIMQCSECGVYLNEPADVNYCPSCGAKVVD